MLPWMEASLHFDPTRGSSESRHICGRNKETSWQLIQDYTSSLRDGSREKGHMTQR